MSSPCAAVAATLTLTDNDIKSNKARNSSNRQSHRLVKRDVHIYFCFALIFDGQDASKPRLGPVTWDYQSSSFCGKCGSCSFLQGGTRRTLECVNLESLLSSYILTESLAKKVQISVHLHTFEYFREPPGSVLNKNHVKAAKICLLTLQGSVSLVAECEGMRSIKSAEDITVPFEIYAEKDDPTAKHLNIHRRPLDHVTLSDSNLDKIRGWLQDCDENHQKCQGNQYLPTRLIHVGAQNTQLIITSSLSQCPKYIALSYCWGSQETFQTPLTTTHITLADRLDGISVDIMPRTFQDVVTVARALQIQYVWIDSLCIIQDDDQDWQIESSRMADIFNNAYLTVIAATGESCNDGFLHREGNRACYSIPFISAKQPLVSGHYSLRHQPGKNWWSTDKMAEISGHRWISRGWTFQEERLANRTLIFGENKFFFDCRTEEKVEDSEVKRIRPGWAETAYEDSELGKGGAGTRIVAGAGHNLPSQFDHWQTVCSHYSYRVLTFAKDKLPAISGMASKINQKTGSDYLGGLWRDHLAHDLFWQTVQIPNKPEKYRAPSWTWAALDGKIRWESWLACVDDGCKMYCEILDAQTTVIGRDPFGEVSDGHLSLSAVVVKVCLSWGDSHANPRYPWVLSVNGENIANADLDAKDTDSSDKTVCAALVAKCTGQNSVPRGLLLRKTGQQRNEIDLYQRVGVFKVVHDADKIMTAMWEEPIRQKIVVI